MGQVLAGDKHHTSLDTASLFSSCSSFYHRAPLQVLVCVGTGHHTKGRNAPRLPIAVERYLAEDEHLQFFETQPGMLRVLL